MDSKCTSEEAIWALSLARKLHKGQKDKRGYPYTDHICQVTGGFLAAQDWDAAVVAAFHDILEDAKPEDKVQFWEAINKAFPSDISDAVCRITRAAGETYKEYIRNLAGNELARRVKLADLESNLDSARYDESLESLYERYRWAYRYLSGSTENDWEDCK